MNEDQLQIEGVQEVDIERLRGDIRQQTDRLKLEQISEALGWLVTSYAINHHEMPRVVQVNGVDQQGLPITRFEIR